MILISLHHGMLEPFHATQSHVGMALYVRLCQHIQTILVAKVIEIWIVGIMARSYGIDIQTFHQEHILLHLLARHGSSIHGTVVVTIDTTNDDRLAIDGQSTLGIHTHFAHTQLAASQIHRFTILVECYHQIVKIRQLCTPQFRILHRQTHLHLSIASHRGRSFAHHVCAIHHLHLQGTTLYVSSFHFRCQVHVSDSVVAFQARRHEEVVNPRFWSRPKEHVASDARESPIVLALNERTARETIHLHGKHILSFLKQVGNLEF